MELKKKRIAVIGGGIVGLAMANEIRRRWPDAGLIVLEKESSVGRHQTSHNSGVIHSGIYYTPGSLKAILAREGMRRMIAYCQEHSIPFEQCGKLIVATKADEIPFLEELHQRGLKNKLRSLRVLMQEQIREYEPHAAGLRALLVPEAGIVDYSLVLEKLKQQLIDKAVEIRLECRVERGHFRSHEWVLETSQGGVVADFVVNCGGLFSDRLCRSIGQALDAQIIPFRGEYFSIADGGKHLVKNLIYPVPRPDLPFLGVHLSRCIDGRLEAGPNAVLAWAREGYRHSDINLQDVLEYSRFSGFWRMSWKNLGVGISEYRRSFSRKKFLQSLQQLVPALESAHLQKSGSGVRAQVVLKNGELLNDFLFKIDRNCLHVVNAPSPAATASFAIAEHLVNQIATH